MRTLLVTTLFAAATGLAAPSGATAQALSLELRGGLNRPVSDFRDRGGIAARGDAGFGGDVIFSVGPTLSLYGGYAWDRFGCVDCEDGDWITSRGFEAGAKVLFSTAERALPGRPWVRLGVVANKAELQLLGFDSTSDTGVGFQGSVGVDLPLGEVLSFSPALRYQRFSAEFTPVGDLTVAKTTVSYLSLDLGLHIHPQLQR